MKLDHIGYLVKDSNRSLSSLKEFFPTVLQERKLQLNQDVYVTYLKSSDSQVTLELVEPADGNTKLKEWLARDGRVAFPYHLCFFVEDFAAKRQAMRRDGWMSLTKPFSTFDPGLVASHMFKPDAGIIEILGAGSPLP